MRLFNLVNVTTVTLSAEDLVKKVAKHYRLAPELARNLEQAAAVVSMSETAIVEDALRLWLFSKRRELIELQSRFKDSVAAKN